MGEWRAVASEGRVIRLKYILECLRIPAVPDTTRYQLLHRAASAVLAAKEFHARTSVMLVHSFSPTNKWLGDFHAFTELFGKRPNIGEIVSVGRFGDCELLVGWCSGDQRFRTAVPVLPAAEANDNEI